MEYKKETIACYDTHKDTFELKFKEDFEKYARKDTGRFLALIKGKKILDLGSGPGHHALYFKKNGCDVLCVDLSIEMVNLCKEKGLKAMQMDIEKLDFPGETFDGIWAYNSLLHIPKKNIKKSIIKLHKILKNDGILALAFKEGDDEGFEEGRFPGSKRWFSKYTDKEIRALFTPYFKIIDSKKDFKSGVDYAYLKYVLVKVQQKK